jgi:hypothetical protein
MAAPRSPNYPRINLKDAIEGVRKIWKENGQNRITSEAVIHHLGYKSNNGSAQGAISGLRKYGLLADGGEGKLRVSDLAVDLLEGKGDPEVYGRAIHKAAFRPVLFQEMRKDFPEGVPNLDSLRFHLVKRGFNSEAAARAAKTFRETVELVTGTGASYTAHDEPEVNGESSEWAEDNHGEELPMRSQEPAPHASLQGSNAPPPPAMAPAPPPAAPPPAGFKQDVFTLSEGQVVLRWPDPLSEESYEDFKDWLELVRKRVARGAGVKDGAKGGARS